MAGIALQVPRDVQEYATSHQLHECLQYSFKLIEDVFPGVCSIATEYVEDPESAEEWIAVTARVPFPVSDIIVRDDVFSDRWLTTVPLPASRLIRHVFERA